MHFGFMTLLKMNKNGYHLEMLFNFPFPKNGFPSKCFKGRVQWNTKKCRNCQTKPKYAFI